MKEITIGECITTTVFGDALQYWKGYYPSEEAAEALADEWFSSQAKVVTNNVRLST